MFEQKGVRGFGKPYHANVKILLMKCKFFSETVYRRGQIFYRLLMKAFTVIYTAILFHFYLWFQKNCYVLK